MDVPIGPNNRIEPGGPDLGQPTHFLPARQDRRVPGARAQGVHAADQRLTWTLTVNGQTTQIPLRLHRDYNVNPFRDIAVGNKPPIVRLAEKGRPMQGPVA